MPPPGASHSARAPCPRCGPGAPLEGSGDTPGLFTCTRCQGELVVGALAVKVLQADLHIDGPTLARLLNNSHASALSCPQCRRDLRGLDLDGYRVDACKACGLLWSPAGALHTMTKGQRGAPANASAKTAPFDPFVDALPTTAPAPPASVPLEAAPTLPAATPRLGLSDDLELAPPASTVAPPASTVAMPGVGGDWDQPPAPQAVPSALAPQLEEEPHLSDAPIGTGVGTGGGTPAVPAPTPGHRPPPADTTAPWASPAAPASAPRPAPAREPSQIGAPWAAEAAPAEPKLALPLPNPNAGANPTPVPLKPRPPSLRIQAPAPGGSDEARPWPKVLGQPVTAGPKAAAPEALGKPPLVVPEPSHAPARGMQVPLPWILGAGGVLVAMGVIGLAMALRGDGGGGGVFSPRYEAEAPAALAPARPPSPDDPVPAGPLETMDFGGRPLSWWQKRLDELATKQSQKSRRLYALTKARAEGMGFIVDTVEGKHRLRPKRRLYDEIGARIR